MTKIANPHQAQPTSLKALALSLTKNRQLIYQMTRREVIGRYKGSFVGIAWSFFNPLLMLVIYTFVFSVVFKSRWGNTASESKTEFALILFAGMIVLGLFSEAVARSSGLILNNINYVKKVVFPLEVLPLVNLGVALFHSLISFAVLLAAFLLLNGFIKWTIILLPFVLFPLIFLILGITWFIASLGVFVRDLGQIITILLTMLMFLSPVFYPISSVPLEFQFWMMVNPLSFIIDQTRAVLIFGEIPNWFGLLVYGVASVFVMMAGFVWFQKTRKGFADVL